MVGTAGLWVRVTHLAWNPLLPSALLPVAVYDVRSSSISFAMPKSATLIWILPRFSTYLRERASEKGS